MRIMKYQKGHAIYQDLLHIKHKENVLSHGQSGVKVQRSCNIIKANDNAYPKLVMTLWI
jgi:hypothetical protein